MRPLALILAALALTGFLWQFQLNASRPGMEEIGPRLWIMARFFTHFATLLAAFCLLRAALGRRDPNLAAMTLIATTMTGLVYAILIAPPEPLPVPQWYPDALLHRVVPLGMALWWLAYAPRPARFRPFLWVAPGLIYLPYALGRGILTGRWPYRFMDPTAQPLTMVLVNLTVVTLAFLAMTLVVQGLGLLFRKPLLLQE